MWNSGSSSIKKMLKPRTSLIPRSSNRPLSGQIHDCPGHPHHCSGFFNHAMSFTSSLALSSPVLPASQCNIRHLFCAECKMLSWLRRGSRKGLFCHFWQLHHWSAERTWEWPAVSAPSSPPPRLMPKPHGSLMMSQPQSSLVVAFLQLSQHGHVVPQPILPVLVLQLHLLPYALTPQICLLGLLVPQPSDTSIRALGLLLIPVPSISLHTCVAYPIYILQVASCWSNSCRSAQAYANQRPSLPPIGLQLCQIQQGPNSSLGEEGFHSKFVFRWLLPFSPGVSCRFSNISWLPFDHSLMIFIVISSCLNYCVVSASWLDPNWYRDIFYIFI